MRAVHVDSRKLIVTDNRHTQAAPLYEETYKRLAACMPPLAEKAVAGDGRLHRVHGGWRRYPRWAAADRISRRRL